MEARRTAEMEREWAVKLEARRAALRAKLDAEEAGYAEELAGRRVSPEARRAELEKRARELLLKREEERRKLAEELEYRKWKETNSEVRAAARARLEQEVELGRLEQMVERHRLEEEKENERGRLNAAIFKHQEDASRRAKDSEEASKMRRAAHLRALREQISVREMDRHARSREEQAERERLNAQWSIENAEFERTERDTRTNRSRMHDELDASNKQHQLAKLKEMELERQLDAQLVQNAIEQERIYEEELLRRAERQSKEDEMFKECLDKLMLDRRRCQHEEDLRTEKERHMHDKREQERHERQERAREELLQEVNEVRAQQVAELVERRRANEEEERKWRQIQEEDLRLARRELDEKLRAAHDANILHQRALLDQIKANAMRERDAERLVDESIDEAANGKFERRYKKESRRQVYLF